MKKKIRLPSSELEIMIIIWEIGHKVSTSDIMLKINNSRTVQLVQSYLKRLEYKNFVKVEKLGLLNYYIPLVTLEEYRSQETTNLMNIFYEESATKLFTALISNKQISNDELKKIRNLIEAGEN